MHEIGMLHQTAKIADEYAVRNGFSEVGTIFIDVGELSGALPDVFTEYFNYVAKGYPRLKNTRLEIRTIAGEGLCSECKCLYNIMRCEGICPRCSSRNKKILGGQEVRLRSIMGM